MRRKLEIFLVIFLLLSCISSFAESNSDRIWERIGENSLHGIVLRDRGLYAEAAKTFEKSLRTIEELEKNSAAMRAGKTEEEKLYLAYWTATCYRKASAYKEALDFYGQTLKLSGKLNSSDMNIEAHRGIALVYAGYGAYREACDELNQGRDRGLAYIKLQAGLPGALEENREYWTVAQKLRKTHLALLEVLHRSGRYKELLALAGDEEFRSLHNAIRKASRAEIPPNSPVKERLWLLWDMKKDNDEYDAQVNLLKGIASRNLRDFNHSAEWLQNAVDNSDFSSSSHIWARMMKDSICSEPPSIRITSGDSPGLELRRALATDNKFIRKIHARLELAKTLYREEKLQRAVQCIEDATEDCRALTSLRELYHRDLMVWKAGLLNVSGDHRGALAALEMGIGEDERSGVYDPVFTFYATRTLGEIYENAGNLNDAIRAYKKAIEITDFLAPSNVAASPGESFEEIDRCYQGIIRSLGGAGYPGEALLYSESLKNCRIATLCGSLPFFSGDKDPVELRCFRSRVRNAKEQIEEILENPESPEDLHILRKKSLELKNAYGIMSSLTASGEEKLLHMLRGGSPRVEEIQRLLDEKTALLHFYYEKVPPVNDRTLRLWVITKDVCAPVELTCEGDELDRDLSLFGSRIMSHSHLWADISKKLYRELIDPARQYIGDKTRIIIEPDGNLYYLPFGALLDPQNVALCDKYSMSLIPSGLFYRPGEIFSPTMHLPVISAQGSTPAIIDALQGAYAPVQTWDLSSFGAGGINGRKAGIIHFASRCDINSFSFLDSGFPDIDLTPDRIVNLSIPSITAIIEKSSTDCGGIYGGSEIASFYGIFSYAGASILIFSLWELPDDVRKEFLVTLYKELRLKRPEEALRSAQRLMRVKHPLPFFWAPYVIYGGTSWPDSPKPPR